MKSDKIILFDGVCNLCNSSVQFIIKHEKDNHFKFASLHSNFAQEILSENNIDTQVFDSIILIETNQLYFKSNAILRIATGLKKPYELLRFLRIFPLFIRDFFYDIVAKYRYKCFGKKETCFLPNEAMKSRFIK